MPIPQPGLRSPPTTAVPVYVPVNSPTATTPTNDPNPPPPDLPDHGTGNPITFPGITSPCDKFPFGIFCWITDQFGEITGAAPIPWHVNVDFPAITTPGGMGITAKTFNIPAFTWDFGNPPASTYPFLQALLGNDFSGAGGTFGFLRDVLGLFLWIWGIWVYGKRKFGGKGLPDGDGTLPEGVVE
jgi:hypothetical protein